MTMHDYVESLRSKHAHLEQEIDDELHRPLPDQSILTRLKREKLRIKDEIARLGGARSSRHVRERRASLTRSCLGLRRAIPCRRRMIAPLLGRTRERRS